MVMMRPLEPVGAQQGRAEIDEQAQRDAKPQDQIEHARAPLEPFDQPHGPGKDGKAAAGKAKVDDIGHHNAPAG
ncbi:MAG: hypothetical protein ACT4OK_03390 [Gemmobacter sp.]